MTLEELATELGVDLATAKPEAVSKVRTYLSDADTKYQTATSAQKKAQEELEAAKAERAEIDRTIAQYGEDSVTVETLRANNAAMEASLKALKDGGLNVNIPTPVPTTAAKTDKFDPNSFRQDVNASLVAGFNLNNKYQRLYGKPLPVDIDVLAREAAAARKPFEVYAAEKFDFAGEEKRQAEKSQKEHDDKIASEAVAKYREANPQAADNPFMRAGKESQNPNIFKPKKPSEISEFANLSAREKIAASVQRTRQTIAANQ